jgi:ubiquitin-conjugating enzyme E2 I
MKQLVLGIQELLDNPNLDSPAQQEAFSNYRRDRDTYVRKVKEQAKRHAAAD